ncbi:peptide deformylase [Campylobacter sp. RM16192]|uniref:peptide deformylase n=1 Tax=Campylobacter sp. RM16192 TaxID=1660080 RepID=UPI001451C068|nr:peptide deformylase [Campylobacter sp. RM16192]QCD53376.1 peptide deformylase [Campylobacter sp. RM16192]
MILAVLTYPDKRLYQKSSHVDIFDQNLHTLLDNMYDTMIAKNGIGLAAIQVGNPIRALIINLVNEESEIQERADLFEIINPKIVCKEGEQIFQEGCLSVPGFYEDVKRAEKITLNYHDRYGKECELEADGLLAVAIQHEMDHLDGHLFIEKIGYNKRKKFDKEYRKLKNKTL